MRGSGFVARKMTSVLLTVTMLVTGLQYQPPPAVAKPAPPTRTEAVDKRTANSKTFEISDGTFETEVYPEPVFYASETTTTLQPIDTTLAEVTTPRGRFMRSKANTFSTLLPERIDEGWVSIEASQGTVSFRPADRPTVARADTAEDSVAVRVPFDDSTARYRRAFAGADLAYTSTPTGVKETVVLPAWAGRNVFGFDLIAPGLTPRQDEVGGVALYSTESTTPCSTSTRPTWSIHPPMNRVKRPAARRSNTISSRRSWAGSSMWWQIASGSPTQSASTRS